MATPRIWYYPGRNLHTIDLQWSLGESEPRPSRDVDDVYSLDGTLTRTLLGGGVSLRVSMEFSLAGATGKTLYRELQALEAHLFRGGVCALTEDADKCWLGHSGGDTPTQGNTYLNTPGGNRADTLGGSAPATGDELIVESALPEGLRETVRVAAGLVTDEKIPLTDAIRYDFTQGVTARHRQFYPVLVLPEPRSILSTRHRILATFEAEFYMPPSALITADTWLLRGASGPSGYTLDELVALGGAGGTLGGWSVTGATAGVGGTSTFGRWLTGWSSRILP